MRDWLLVRIVVCVLYFNTLGAIHAGHHTTARRWHLCDRQLRPFVRELWRHLLRKKWCIRINITLHNIINVNQFSLELLRQNSTPNEWNKWKWIFIEYLTQLAICSCSILLCCQIIFVCSYINQFDHTDKVNWKGFHLYKVMFTLSSLVCVLQTIECRKVLVRNNTACRWARLLLTSPLAILTYTRKSTQNYSW